MVSLSGDLDIDSSTEFSTRVDAVTAAAAVHVIVEVSGVRFIDSSGLNALVVSARDCGSRRLARRRSAVAVRRPRLRSRGLGESVDIVGSVDEALALHTALSQQADPQP